MQNNELKNERYICPPCGFVYDPKEGDPDGGIPPGMAFEDVPDDWLCPWCGLPKDAFVLEDQYYTENDGSAGSKVGG